MSAHSLRLTPENTALLVIDVQERLLAAMPEAAGAACVRSIDALLEGARVLRLPVIVSEQYPKGLGRTTPPLADRLASFAEPVRVYEKLEFDAFANAEIARAVTAVAERGVTNVVVTGMEAHICVYQTVRGLAAHGLSVHVPADATCSRTAANAKIARGLWARCGAVVTSTEAVLFDLVGRAGTDAFKAISKLVK